MDYSLARKGKRDRPREAGSQGGAMMISMSRRSALKLSLSTAVAMPAIFRVSRVKAADFTLKYANNAPLSHPLTIRVTEAAEAIRNESGGKIEIQVYPNGQLGGDTDM